MVLSELCFIDSDTYPYFTSHLTFNKDLTQLVQTTTSNCYVLQKCHIMSLLGYVIFVIIIIALQ